MIQSLLLGVMLILCFLIILSLFKNPEESDIKNPCRFKILSPKYSVIDGKKVASFNIIVEKTHRYFINFPLLFRFYGDKKYRINVKAFYSLPGSKEDKKLILDKEIEFIEKTREFTVYITDIIMGKLSMEIEIEINYGIPIIGFEILENSTCKLVKEHKIEIRFPED
jgi:hypothetical protein